MLDRGVRVAAGSDAPVEPPDPWPARALARHRAGLVPQEGVTASQALAMFTTNGAAALGEPPPLEAGSSADFIVVDRDPLLASPDDLVDTQVVATYSRGAAIEVDRSLPTWND